MATAAADRPTGAWGVALFVLVIGAFMSILDSSIVNIAIPTIENQFGVNTAQVQWVVTVYLLALGVVVPASGWLGERYGLKQIYIFALIVFTIGSALCGLSWSLGALTLFRVLQAVGGGLIMPVTMSLVYRIVPRERIGTAMGFWGLALITAPAIGPTLGGYLVEYVNWRLIFYVNVPIGIVGVLLAMATVPNLPGRVRGPFDWGGLATAGIGLFALLLAFSEGQTWGWGSEAIVLLFYGSVVSLILFVYLQLTSKHPLLDLKVFRYGSFGLANGLSMVVSVALFSGIFYVPLFLQTVVGYGALETGLMMMPAALVTAVFMPISGRLYDRFGARPLVVVGMAILAWGTFLLHNITATTPPGAIIVWLSIRSVGIGLSMMPLTTAGMSAVPTMEMPSASAINNILQRISGSFGLAILTVVLESQTTTHAANLATGYSPANPAAMGYMAMFTHYLATQGMTAVQAGQVTLTMLAGQVQQQAFVMGMDDLFTVTTALIGVALVLAFFLKTYWIHGQQKPGMASE